MKNWIRASAGMSGNFQFSPRLQNRKPFTRPSIPKQFGAPFSHIAMIDMRADRSAAAGLNHRINLVGATGEHSFDGAIA
jgi:hypothetical protein